MQEIAATVEHTECQVVAIIAATILAGGHARGLTIAETVTLARTILTEAERQTILARMERAHPEKPE